MLSLKCSWKFHPKVSEAVRDPIDVRLRAEKANKSRENSRGRYASSLTRTYEGMDL